MDQNSKRRSTYQQRFLSFQFNIGETITRSKYYGSGRCTQYVSLDTEAQTSEDKQEQVAGTQLESTASKPQRIIQQTNVESDKNNISDQRWRKQSKDGVETVKFSCIVSSSAALRAQARAEVAAAIKKVEMQKRRSSVEFQSILLIHQQEVALARKKTEEQDRMENFRLEEEAAIAIARAEVIDHELGPGIRCDELQEIELPERGTNNQQVPLLNPHVPPAHQQVPLVNPHVPPAHQQVPLVNSHVPPVPQQVPLVNPHVPPAHQQEPLVNPPVPQQVPLANSHIHQFLNGAPSQQPCTTSSSTDTSTQSPSTTSSWSTPILNLQHPKVSQHHVLETLTLQQRNFILRTEVNPQYRFYEVICRFYGQKGVDR
ncbi:Hypothetical predicted protein [Paramuricea clavata]|uniref:Uncharacterized protein n=1 Tax=Paramuricea clavata TaxID=317549 RepID=A0A7D9I3M2_PARCT|nr:Hypothetical predicted protein [Paramuricea clavata]